MLSKSSLNPFVSITESIPITWNETIASNEQITSDCLLDDKTLMLRICDSRYEEWIPSRDDIELLYCNYYQPSYEEHGNCPPEYVGSKTYDLCYREIISQPWEDLCLITGGSSLSLMDLNSTAQYSVLQQLLTSNPPRERQLNIGIPAKNMWPSKRISSEIDYTTEDVELQ